MMNTTQKNIIKLLTVFICTVFSTYLVSLIINAFTVHTYAIDTVSTRTRTTDDFDSVQYLALANSDQLRSRITGSYTQLVNQLLAKHYETHKNLERRASITSGVEVKGNVLAFQVVFLPSNTRYDVSVTNSGDKSRAFTLEMKEKK